MNLEDFLDPEILVLGSFAWLAWSIQRPVISAGWTPDSNFPIVLVDGVPLAG